MTANQHAPAGRAGDARPEMATSPVFALSQLVKLHWGHRLRRKRKDPRGQLQMAKFYLLGSSAVATGELYKPLEQALIRTPRPDACLQTGDIVLYRKPAGYGILAPLELPESSASAICVAPLCFFRIADQATLCPAYLVWFLRTSVGQTMLGRFIGQGTAREVLVAGLDAVYLHLPDRAMQQDIIDLACKSASHTSKVELAEQERQRRTEATLLAMAKLCPVDGALLLAQPGAVH